VNGSAEDEILDMDSLLGGVTGFSTVVAAWADSS